MIKLTSADSSIKNLNIRIEDISTVYIKETSSGRWTAVVVNSVTYFVTENIDYVLSKLNKGWFS